MNRGLNHLSKSHIVGKSLWGGYAKTMSGAISRFISLDLGLSMIPNRRRASEEARVYLKRRMR
jgi:hypothetical protein